MDGAELAVEDLELPWIGPKIGYNAVRCIAMPRDPTIQDFSLYHAVLNSVLLCYRTLYADGKTLTETELVEDFAVDVVEALTAGKPTPYSLLRGGQLAADSSFIQKYTVEGLISPSVGCAGIRPDEVIIEYISRTIGHGIIVLDEARQDVCLLGCEAVMRELKMESYLVLLYRRATATEPATFSMVGLLPYADGDEPLDPEEIIELTKNLFRPDHPFIEALYSRIDALSERRAEMTARR